MDAKLKKLLLKTAIFAISISFAWWIVKSGYLQSSVEALLPLRFIAEITAGLFYTSFLTSPIAVAMLIVLAQDNNPILTALLAGAGASLGDFLILRFFRKEVTADLSLVSKQLHLQKISKILQVFRLDFTIPLLGAAIVASPFPDELGLMMMGVSRLSYRQIAVVTYILNTVGILLIVSPLNLLS